MLLSCLKASSKPNGILTLRQALAKSSFVPSRESHGSSLKLMPSSLKERLLINFTSTVLLVYARTLRTKLPQASTRSGFYKVADEMFDVALDFEANSLLRRTAPDSAPVTLRTPAYNHISGGNRTPVAGPSNSHLPPFTGGCGRGRPRGGFTWRGRGGFGPQRTSSFHSTHSPYSGHNSSSSVKVPDHIWKHGCGYCAKQNHHSWDSYSELRYDQELSAKWRSLGLSMGCVECGKKMLSGDQIHLGHAG